MRIKVIYREFEHKIEDVVFKLREIDMGELLLTNMKMSAGTENKAQIDMGVVINSYISKCLIGWVGNVEYENEKGEVCKLEFSEENKMKLPFVYKQELYLDCIGRTALTEKKSGN